MPDQIQQTVGTLIAARHRAGLSQRALSAKVGLAQSHISKIERGAVDPQLSSLVEIARSLGHELMLVPAQLVPAVRALQRETVPNPRDMPTTVDRDLTRLARQARELTTRFPTLRALSDIAVGADELRIARIDESAAAEARRLIDAATRILNRLRDYPPDRAAIEDAASTADELTSIARAIRNLRNEWFHRDTSSSQLPAYRLDDSDA